MQRGVITNSEQSDGKGLAMLETKRLAQRKATTAKTGPNPTLQMRENNG
ncbi:hypothetical protein SAMN04488044_2521 [Cognatishimia maritima]|uniref:Uncharacterized protein n=1 Tax=Cognatishimia maritima TaxID=870908 RepID=A0A1M5SWU2_9RHOB|nr:hypothetical protein SAMN04488044_2521 [Cognatishimia maritima]